MSTNTPALTPLGIVEAIIAAVQANDYPDALRLAKKGQDEHPKFVPPGHGTAPWATLQASIIARMPEEPAAPVEPEPETAAQKIDRLTAGLLPEVNAEHAAQVSADHDAEQARVAAEEAARTAQEELLAAPTYGAGPAFGDRPAHGTLTITHGQDHGTRLLGTQPHDGTWDIMGVSGQRWSFRRGKKWFALHNSEGWAADEVRITHAANALRRAGWNVDVEVDNKVTYARHNMPVKDISAPIRKRHAECGRATRDQEWIDSPALLAEHAAQRAETPLVAPKVRAVRPVSAMPAPSTVEVCRALPAAPQRAIGPVPSAVAQLREMFNVGPVVEPTVEDLATVDHNTLIERMLSGDTTAAEEIRVRLLAPVIPNGPVREVPTALPTPATPTVKPAAPAVRIEKTDSLPGSWSRTFTGPTSGGAARAVATAFRIDLNRYVTNKHGSKGDRPQISVSRRRGTVDLPGGSTQKVWLMVVSAELPAGVNANAFDRGVMDSALRVGLRWDASARVVERELVDA